MKKFWMVYRYGGGKPVKTHDTPEEAIAEAHRLSLKEPGDYYVLETRGMFRSAIVSEWLKPEPQEGEAETEVDGEVEFSHSR